MAPKKEAAPAAAAAPALSPEDAAARVQLIEECRAAKEAVLAETAAAAAFLAEKEKLNALWVATKTGVENARAEARALERAAAEGADERRAELSVHANRIRALLLGGQAALTRERVDATTALKLAEERAALGERELKADLRDLAVASKEAEVAGDDLARSARLEADRAVAALRLEFERDTRELAALYEGDKMARAREELDAEREAAARAVDRRKARQVAALLAAHEKAFADMKLYFNEITHSNLDLVKALKEEVDELRKKEAADEKVMFAIASENKKMSEPLKKALEAVRALREKREEYRANIAALHEAKAAALVEADRLESARWEHEILEQRYARLLAERDALAASFSAAVHEVKQKAGFKALVLEAKLSAAAGEAEREGLALGEMLAAARLEPSAAGGAAASLAGALAEKDALIDALKAELADAARRHDAALAFFERRLAEDGLKPAELGFTPLRAADVLAGVVKTA